MKTAIILLILATELVALFALSDHNYKILPLFLVFNILLLVRLSNKG